MPDQDKSLRLYQGCLEQLLRESTAAIARIRHVDRNGSDINILALFASLIELGNAAERMISLEIDAGANSIFRSFLEGIVDLKNLCEVEGYREQLVYEYNKGWLRHLIEAANGNPYLSQIAEDDGLQGRIADCQRYIDQAEAAGIRQMQIRTKFERAGMLHEYNSIYGSVSSGAHMGMRYLISRHLSVEGEEATIAINQFDPEQLMPILDSYCALMLQALNLISERYELVNYIPLDALADSLRQARAA